MQLEPMLLTRLADLSRVGRAPPGRRVAAVALPTLPAAGHGDPGARMGQVGHHLTGVAQPHLGADGHLDVAVVAALPVLPRALPMHAPLGAEVGRGAKPVEIAQVGPGHQGDVAAVPAVAAVGPALRDVLLAPEADAAVAAAAALDLDRGAVGEHGRRPALGRLAGLHADVAAAVLARERDRAVDRREHGVVAAEPGAVAGVEAGAALAHDDRACRHGLA